MLLQRIHVNPPPLYPPNLVVSAIKLCMNYYKRLQIDLDIPPNSLIRQDFSNELWQINENPLYINVYGMGANTYTGFPVCTVSRGMYTRFGWNK